jgi:hypothetical protein
MSAAEHTKHRRPRSGEYLVSLYGKVLADVLEKPATVENPLREVSKIRSRRTLLLRIRPSDE